ncbi:alpha/beta fold hydrolase [Oceanirhabdus seepicola]|uniref:Alpha/beta fold hydrolase n=1 Tax=Oceanirhabdus seepicola TaxID=2828781 RepID=A0A9J6P5V6_9CLOT|nr:alpha/beta fold hydrolase [Oceanirhabdus seepicola]
MKSSKLEYKIIGDKGPLIVIENGLCCSMYDWHFVVEALKDRARILLYHRAGYGNSEHSNVERTTRNIAIELDNMLEDIRIDEKFIIVGHSFGGLCVQQYVKMYPHKIRGVLLLDSTSPDFEKLYCDKTPMMCEKGSIEATTKGMRESSKKSIEELRERFQIEEEQKGLPDDVKSMLEEFYIKPEFYNVTAMEMEKWYEDGKDIKSCGEFPNVPLRVIARDMKISIQFYVNLGMAEEEAVAYESIWRGLQEQYTLLSKDSKFIVAEGSDHMIQLEKPKYVTEAIEELL